jgi:hypothetical protein
MHVSLFANAFAAQNDRQFHDWARLSARYLAPASTGRDNFHTMRVLLSLFLTAALGLGTYYIYLKHASPGGPGTLPTDAISTTGVEMDLNGIAQAERNYNAQNGSYATMDELLSSGALTVAKPGRNGYTYTVDAATTGFTVTAKWRPANPQQASLHYPTFVVDQTMQVHQIQ